MGSSNEIVSQALMKLSSNHCSTLAYGNMVYFSLSPSDKVYHDKAVIQDPIKFINNINRGFSNTTDQFKCSVALHFCIGTANNLVEQLIDIHQFCWKSISTDFILFCKKPLDCKKLQLDILNLELTPGETIHAFYVRAASLVLRLSQQKPQHNTWGNQEAGEAFAKSISPKFYRSLSDDDMLSLRAVFHKALKFIESRPSLHHLYDTPVESSPIEQSSPHLVAAVADNNSQTSPSQLNRKMHNERMISKIPQPREGLPILTPYCVHCLDCHPSQYCSTQQQAELYDLPASLPSVGTDKGRNLSVLKAHVRRSSRSSHVSEEYKTIDRANPDMLTPSQGSMATPPCHEAKMPLHHPYRSIHISPRFHGVASHLMHRPPTHNPYVGVLSVC